MKNKILKNTLIAVIAILFILFIIYTVKPLFTNETINEELPIVIENNTTGKMIDMNISQEENQTILFSSEFSDADNFHKTSGQVKIYQIDDKQLLRLEDFKTTNGPDLKVYVAEDIKAKNFISLGDLKGNIGNQNYEINEKINYQEHNYVLIWCEDFSTLFGYAKLE